MFNFKTKDPLREILEANTNDPIDEETQDIPDPSPKTKPKAKSEKSLSSTRVSSSKPVHSTTLSFNAIDVEQNDFTALIQKQVSKEVDEKVREAVAKLEKRYASGKTFGDGGDMLSSFIGNIKDTTRQKGINFFPWMKGQEEKKEDDEEIGEEKEEWDDEGEVVGEGDEGNKAMYLDEDTYTMMMISPMDWSLPKCLCFTFVPCALLVGRGSWVFGLVPPFIELLLCGIIISDQTDFDVFTWIKLGTFPGSLNIPSERQSNPVYIGQFFAMILALMTQSDVLSATQTFLLLRNSSRVPWQRTISRDGKEEIVGGCCTWVARVFIPVFLKFLQGIFVLFITWLIIVQSTNVVDLLKDYTALFVISSIDNIFYLVASNGYLGHQLATRAQEAKGVKIYTDVSYSQARGNNSQIFLFVLMLVGMLGGWVATMIGQIQGKTESPFIWKLPDTSDN